jgi:hypothetical protein
MACDYKIIKFSSNKNPNIFFLDISKMKDIRIRNSILYSSYQKYTLGISNYKPVYDVFDTVNYTFITIHKAYNIKYKDIKLIKDDYEKYYKNKKYEIENDLIDGVVCFI